MIIKFDQSPEEYFRLSRMALERKELDRAMIYGEKALRGKGTTEYKLSLAEIFLSMGRHAEAADLALDALCHGKGMRAEIYDLLARAASEMGLFYESVHYIAKKANYEGDDDALDAMDEVMQEITAKEEPEGSPFFVVGKEPKRDDTVSLMHASFALSRGEMKEAIEAANEIAPDSEHFLAARNVRLRAFVRLKADEEAVAEAEEIVKSDPKNAYALCVLVDRYKRKEYLPMLADVEGSREDLYFATVAAERMGEHGIAGALADKMIARDPYLAEAYFAAAAVALNGGDRAKSEDLLKRLFELYPKYPAGLILKGWRKLNSCNPSFRGRIPEGVERILTAYVRKGAGNSELFLKSLLTDETYRAALTLLMEEGEEDATGRALRFFGEENNKQADAFFAKQLLRNEIDVLLKRAILAELLFHKEKGKIFLAQTVVPIGVSCVKPPRFGAYCDALKQAYVNVYSFVVAMTDGSGEERVWELAEEAHRTGVAEEESPAVVIAALLHRLLTERLIPMGSGAHTVEDACRFIMMCVFGVSRFSFARAKKISALLGR